MKKQYQPKGGMCLSCTKKFKDCSNIDFKVMPKIKDLGEVIIVKCLDFKRSKDE